ncbi:hypothetical protein [Nannocystis sp.]|uniref:hypothetical protein n=1 Tax=Nannocystis sp. TaxID=1962667 RepID=UPI0025E385CC|nr:hypothetical protein [Nannocystis sp.]MBK7829756.1 hypothetical protein [Nannocystis sp.]
MISAYLQPLTTLSADIPEASPANCQNAPFSKLGNYRLKLEGIRSLSCAGDDDPEGTPGCRMEEGFITWTLFTPQARWSGRTNLETQLYPAYGADAFNTGNLAPSAVWISDHALLLWRVFEKDGSFYDADALKAAQTAGTAIHAMIDWSKLIPDEYLDPNLIASYDTLSRVGIGSDDAFELGAGGDLRDTPVGYHPRLREPSAAYPFGVPNGDYLKKALRTYDSDAHFRTWISFLRQ